MSVQEEGERSRRDSKDSSTCERDVESHEQRPFRPKEPFFKRSCTRNLVRVFGGIIGLVLLIGPIILFKKMKIDVKTTLVLLRFIFFGVLVMLAEFRWTYMLNGWLFLTTSVGRGFLFLFISADMYSSIVSEDNNIQLIIVIMCAATLFTAVQSLIIGCAFPEFDHPDLHRYYAAPLLSEHD